LAGDTAQARGHRRNAAGIEAELGAFVVGVLMARSRFQDGEAIARLRSFSDAVFAPLYFASAGLLVSLSALSSWHRVLVVAVLLVVAVVSKALGTRVGAVRARLRRGENAALMILLNGRGALQVIIATAGLRMGLLSNFAYTPILLVSVVSSLLVAPALRRLAGEWEGSEDERLRLAYEDRIDRSVLVREQRLLVPMLDGSNPQLAAALFDHAWPAAAEITLLGAPPGEDVAPLPDVARAVRRRTAASHNLVDAAFEEARLGYGAFGVGVSSAAPRLPPDVIELLNGSPLPVVLVRPAVDDGGQLGPLRHVAVATTGTTAGIAGEELAAGLARRHNARLHVVHVVPDLARRARRPGLPGAFDGVLAEAVARVRRAGLRPSAASVRSASVGRALLDHAAASGIDLLVVGARLRRVGDVPFLGYAVSELLDAPDPLTLVVVALPDAPPTELDQPFVERSMV
jgi:nucleotide-binding universal stress UspA family protein